MNELSELKSKLLNRLAKLERVDMTVQTNVINKCVYEMIKNNEFLCLNTLVEKCNQYYIVQDKAHYGEIVEQRVLKHIGGDNRTAGVNEINNRLSSWGWRLYIGKSTCKAKYFADKNNCIEFDLNSEQMA